MVEKLVEMHGGSVQVQSDTGRGSRFTVVLPWAQSIKKSNKSELSTTGPQENQPFSSKTLAAGNGARILLAEDNETNVMVIKDYLESHGYDVSVAYHGREALLKASETFPALILMDIQMPQMDGLEATRRLRATPEFAAVPIIALTAFAMPGDRERCLAAGVTEYMTKPVHLRKLHEMISDLLK